MSPAVWRPERLRLCMRSSGGYNTLVLLATTGPAASHMHIHVAYIYDTYSPSCPNTSRSLLFLRPLHTAIPLSHRSPPLYIITAAHGEPSLSRQTPLSPTALPRLKLKYFSSLLSPPLLVLLARERRVFREVRVAFVARLRSTDATRDQTVHLH